MAPTALLIGAGISAAGSLMAGQSAMAAGRYSQNIAERNATILDSKADQSVALGEHNVKKFSRAFASQQASTQAAYIKAGVKMSGTPMEIMEYNIAEAELEKMNIMYDARMGSYDFKQQAVQARMEGKLAMFQARSARSSAIIGAVGTMVGATGNFMLAKNQAANAKALMTTNAAYATQILNSQAANNKILTDMKSMNAKALIALTNSNAQSLISTDLNNAITLQSHPMGTHSPPDWSQRWRKSH